MFLRRVAASAALLLLTLAAQAAAQDVTLTSHDGLVEIEGTLISYDGEFYRVDTIFGELTLDGTGVTCTGVGCPNLEAYVAEIRVAGARALGQTLLPALLERFAELQGLNLRAIFAGDDRFTYQMTSPGTGLPVARFVFRLGTSAGGFAALAEGEAEFVLSAREATEQERDRALAAGRGDLFDGRRGRIIALDGLVPVASPRNPVTALSLSELRGVLSGTVVNWAQLGGIDAAIALHLPAPETDLGSVVAGLLPDGAALPPGTTYHRDSAATVDATARDPFALGLSRVSETGNAAPLGLSGECGFAFRPATRALKTGDYPLTAPAFLYTPARRLPKVARAFLRFLETDTAQVVTAATGFADQQVQGIALARQGERFANAIMRAGEETGLEELQRMTEALRMGERLTISFRFEPGSTRLNAQSRANVQKLALLLEAGLFDGQELLFAGFSDGEGAAGANRRIARRRADAVRDAVREAAEGLERGRVTLAADGFGEAMPLACDDSGWGRQANRRVELWRLPAQR